MGIKKTTVHKSAGPGYYAEADTEKGNRGFAHGSTKEEARQKAKENGREKDKKYRF